MREEDPYADISDTPFMDVWVLLLTLALILGGGLAAVYAIGYFAVGRASLAWPLVATLTVLVIVNIGIRMLRASMRRH